MIAILEDRKGFRKEMYIVAPVPTLQVAEYECLGVHKDGFDGNQTVAAKEITFYRIKEEQIFGTTIVLYREIKNG